MELTKNIYYLCINKDEYLKINLSISKDLKEITIQKERIKISNIIQAGTIEEWLAFKDDDLQNMSKAKLEECFKINSKLFKNYNQYFDSNIADIDWGFQLGVTTSKVTLCFPKDKYELIIKPNFDNFKDSFKSLSFLNKNQIILIYVTTNDI